TSSSMSLVAVEQQFASSTDQIRPGFTLVMWRLAYLGLSRFRVDQYERGLGQVTRQTDPAGPERPGPFVP
ncbi:MAG: hypothetical protein ACRCYU_22740, partial [Nocardioides sp.]